MKKVIGEITTNINIMDILEVFSCEENTSDSGVVFYKCGFRAVTVDEKGNSLFSGREKGTATFFAGEQPNVGDRFAGKIYHFDTTPYEIDGREVSKVKVIAFGDETPLDVANNLLERNNACVIMNGKPTKKLKKKVVAKVEEETED